MMYMLFFFYSVLLDLLRCVHAAATLHLPGVNKDPGKTFH